MQIEKRNLLQMPFFYILFPYKNMSFMSIYLDQYQFLFHQDVVG